MRKISLVLVILMSISCSNADGDRTAIEYMPGMMDQVSVKAQEEVMNKPVPGTKPRGFKKYPYSMLEADIAGRTLKNPLEVNRENLLQGQEAYEVFCTPCHGVLGKGNGTVVPKFPMPPTLHSDKIKNWSDGDFFHIMTLGRGLMPSYADQTTEEERWAITLYIRALQRSVDPTNADIKAFEDSLRK